MPNKFSYYQNQLEKKYEQNRFKQLKLFLGHNKKIPAHNFQSYEGIPFSSHDFVKKNTIKYILEFGGGIKSLKPNFDLNNLHGQIEKKMKVLSGYEDCFFLQTDYNIHQYLLNFLAHSKAVIFIDRGCHKNIIKAALDCHGKICWFEHNNIRHLEELLDKHSHIDCTKIVITESVFFDHGDLCYLKAISSLSDEHNAILYVDDSCTFGLMGENGLGFTAFKKNIDIVVGSFGKSFHCFGHYILTSSFLKEAMLELSNEIDSLRKLPPSNLGAIDATLDILPDMEIERQKLQKNAQYVRRLLKEKGLNIGNSSSHIIPIVFQNTEDAKSIYEHLLEKNIQVHLLSSNESKNHGIKVVISSSHSKEQLNALIEEISTWQRPLAYKTL